jgi:uncharacterized protein
MNSKLIDKIKDYIIHICDPELIILFGSYARESQNKYSDIDIVVMCAQVYQKKKLEREIKSWIRQYGIHADILIRSEKEVEESIPMPTTFLGSVMKHGKKIYIRP